MFRFLFLFAFLVLACLMFAPDAEAGHRRGHRGASCGGARANCGGEASGPGRAVLRRIVRPFRGCGG